MSNQILYGDSLTRLRDLPDQSVHCCVTSPPYWGLRDYGIDGQLGLEQSPDDYVTHMTDVFHEVRRVLRDDGTLWLNLGDTYVRRPQSTSNVDKHAGFQKGRTAETARDKRAIPPGLKVKDMVGIPWRVAFALQQDGWYLRCDIVWHKPNPMPLSVTDRPTTAHEYIFLLSKSSKYYYDYEAIKETAKPESVERYKLPFFKGEKHESGGYSVDGKKHTKGMKPFDGKRNKRSVWTVSTKPFRGAHFATFPPDLIEPCVLAGCPEGGVVLDPFFGAGTTGLVALQNGRNYIGIELNPEYIEIARERLANVQRKIV